MKLRLVAAIDSKVTAAMSELQDKVLAAMHQQDAAINASVDKLCSTLPNEFRSLHQGQLSLAEHVTTERVAMAATMQMGRVIRRSKNRLFRRPTSGSQKQCSMLDGKPAPKAFRGAVYVYIMDRFVKKPILQFEGHLEHLGKGASVIQLDMVSTESREGHRRRKALMTATVRNYVHLAHINFR
ncbi:hypothetical protein SDRG_07555 [Saprolegnia diclina VS20]|uniref:Uncharacterized protein n=1 Tax=Saprolegnia diclina (strain VS20) TaxID=1156394 RepID=T0RWL3_SAPDV|nr:hypothetical protein SDRG_07555 [Saprolegnia diclina VS20]EQC34742.1 hypothetical protein SDRG_07555 [Saprolegnia diclina VS20]|eukprot:XP_008611614.1 hypothetical protein SDRG_07555 [Saprolegnia diclina VS20]